MKQKNETLKAIISILIMILVTLACGFMWWLENKIVEKQELHKIDIK